MEDNVIVVNFGASHRCSDPSCGECMLETVIDTYCASHEGVKRDDIRRIIEQGLAFQQSLEESLEAEG